YGNVTHFPKRADFEAAAYNWTLEHRIGRCCGSMRRLKNKTAMVAGGAHGLGKTISEVFAEEGAAVFILDTDEQAGAEMITVLRKREGDATFIRADVSSEDEMGR